MRITAEDWLQAQYSVLGSVLISPEVAPIVAAETSEQDYTGPCLTVYRAIRDLFLSGAAVDPVSIANSLDSGYREFLMHLMQITPTAANLRSYISLCREQARVLSARELGKQLAKTESAASARTLIEQAGTLLSSSQARKTMSMADGLRAFMEKPSRKINYLSWPFPDLSKRLYSGPGDFIILGAEPSVGKTAFALQCGWHWSEKQKVGFFSFETNPEKLFDRLMSCAMGISMADVKNNAVSGSDWDRICQATQMITERKLDLIPAAGMNTADIRFEIMKGGYQVVIIDYLQLIASRGTSRYELVTNISIDLHNMAQSLGVTILALSQLSRSDDERTPKNSDLRESGQLEQDADVIIMLKLAKQSEPGGQRKLFVTKNKEGELFMMFLDFVGKHQTFRKAQQAGETISKFVAEGKRVQNRNKRALQAPGSEQMTLLPGDTPVPFNE